ncbi:hypothetical protein Tter_2865 [Thermobaculum terrenum ATCC BAA-798]|uniref:Uncharacterized protein n=1 Tax=Thermobaculum terrenum (strain ATCC BAA-798 / CCMEE 7001 / YNP1) TaxID=525904 RepID=D1CJ27_THET1|nr:hypothetical protein [Thermobaculum terrenum]ACZ43747.1 hypothetical protein Tter_2865 [Thermobaculum terrenum ATCC BAA-798]
MGWYVVERAAVCGVEMGGVKRCKEHSPWRWDVWVFWEQGYGYGVGVLQGGGGQRVDAGCVGAEGPNRWEWSWMGRAAPVSSGAARPLGVWCADGVA